MGLGAGLSGRSGTMFSLRLTKQPGVFGVPAWRSSPVRDARTGSHMAPSLCPPGGRTSPPSEAPRWTRPVRHCPGAARAGQPLMSAMGPCSIGRLRPCARVGRVLRTQRPGYVPAWRVPWPVPPARAVSRRFPARPAPCAPWFRRPGPRCRRWRRLRRRDAVLARYRRFACGRTVARRFVWPRGLLSRGGLRHCPAVQAERLGRRLG